MNRTIKNQCKVFIHQPDFIPWLNFFKRLNLADVFIILDDVQFNRRGFTNRDYLLINKRKTLVTLPVKKSDRYKSLIKDIEIFYDEKWIKSFLKTIELNYKKTKNFDYIYNFFISLFKKNYSKLIDFNMEIIYFIKSILEIKTKFYFSSNLGEIGKKTEKIFKICKKFEASKYITGEGALDYLDLKKFNENNIEIITDIFVNESYKQSSNNFIKGLSILDVLFNEDFNYIKKIIK